MTFSIEIFFLDPIYLYIDLDTLPSDPNLASNLYKGKNASILKLKKTKNFLRKNALNLFEAKCPFFLREFVVYTLACEALVTMNNCKNMECSQFEKIFPWLIPKAKFLRWIPKASLECWRWFCKEVPSVKSLQMTFLDVQTFSGFLMWIPIENISLLDSFLHIFS